MRKEVKVPIITASLLLGAGLITMGSSCEPETPPNASENASLVAEYDWMEGVDLRDSVESVFESVKSSFKYVGMQAWFYDDPNRIPPYRQFDNSHYYFPDDDVLLRRYTSNYDSDTLYWHLLSADRFELNQSGGAIVYGRSADLNEGVNRPPSPPEERYSLVWTQDIVDAYVNWGDADDIPAALVTTVVHELGHQRAGLTDADEYPKYHYYSGCVMDYGTPITTDPRFCKELDPNLFQESTCLRNLQANYGNF